MKKKNHEVRYTKPLFKLQRVHILTVEGNAGNAAHQTDNQNSAIDAAQTGTGMAIIAIVVVCCACGCIFGKHSFEYLIYFIYLLRDTF